MNTSQKGFGVVEVLVVLTITGLVGAAGWLIYDRQNNKNNETHSAAQTEKSPSTQAANPDSDSMANAVEALDKRLADLSTTQTASANAQYTLESVSAKHVTVEIEDNGEYVEKKPTESNSRSYRLDRVSNEFESYDEYLSNFKAAADDLVNYAISDLGFTKIDSRSVDGPADTYVYTLIKKGSTYCQVGHATLTFISLGCVEQ